MAIDSGNPLRAIFNAALYRSWQYVAYDKTNSIRSKIFYEKRYPSRKIKLGDHAALESPASNHTEMNGRTVRQVAIRNNCGVAWQSFIDALNICGDILSCFKRKSG